MIAKLGRFAKTYLTLLACALVTCVPSGVLRLALCDCNGIVVESCSRVCPCERADAQPDPCCSSEVSDREDSADSGDPDDSCCTDLPMPALVAGGDGPNKVSANDVDREPEFGHVAAVPRGTRARPQLVRATGPPGWHFRRRALEERAVVVLLI